VQPSHHSILIFAQSGVFELAHASKVLVRTELELFKALKVSNTMVFLTNPGQMNLPPAFEISLSAALRHIPFYCALPDDKDTHFTDWITAHLSLFDRVISPIRPGWVPEVCHIQNTGISLETALEVIDTHRFTSPLPETCAPAASVGLDNPLLYYLYTPGIDLVYRKAAFADIGKPFQRALNRAARHTGSTFASPRAIELGCAVGFLPFGCVEMVDYCGLCGTEALLNCAYDLQPDRKFVYATDMSAVDLRTVRCLLIPDLQSAAETLAGLNLPLEAMLRLVIVTGINALGQSGYRTPLSAVQEHLSGVLPGATFSLRNMQLIGLKPDDYIKSTVLLELDAFL